MVMMMGYVMGEGCEDSKEGVGRMWRGSERDLGGGSEGEQVWGMGGGREQRVWCVWGRIEGVRRCGNAQLVGTMRDGRGTDEGEGKERMVVGKLAGRFENDVS